MSDYLFHHGILGQKWGVQNGPPYPLGSGDHSAREKRVGWRASLKEGDQNNKKQITKKDITKAVRSTKKEAILNDYGANHKLSDEQKERIRKALIASTATLGIAGGIYFAVKHHTVTEIAAGIENGLPNVELINIGKKAIEESIDEGIEIIKAGTEFHRMTGFKGYDISKAGNMTYVSQLTDDVKHYMWALADFSGTGTRYDVILKALTDIKIPTDKKAEEIFNMLWNDKQNGYQAKLIDEAYDFLLGACAKRFHATKDEVRQALGDTIRNQLADGLTVNPFYIMSQTMAHRGEATNMYLNKLRELGFNAIKDYHDIYDRVADKPLVILDPSKNLQKIGESLVDAFAMDDARIDTLHRTFGKKKPIWNWSDPVYKVKEDFENYLKKI